MELDDIKEEHLELAINFEELFSSITSTASDTQPNSVKSAKVVSEQIEISNSAKKLYKELAKKLHPDKGGALGEFEELHNRYSNSDLLGIVEMAADNDVNINLSEEDELLLSNSIETVDTQIERLKDTLPYVWKYGNDSDRRQVLMRIADHTGIDIDINELPDEIRDMLGI